MRIKPPMPALGIFKGAFALLWLASAALAFCLGCHLRPKAPAVDVRAALRVSQFNCLYHRDANVSDQRVPKALVVVSLKSPTGRVKGSSQLVVTDLKPGACRPFKLVSKYRGSPPKPKNIEIGIYDPPPAFSD